MKVIVLLAAVALALPLAASPGPSQPLVYDMFAPGTNNYRFVMPHVNTITWCGDCAGMTYEQIKAQEPWAFNPTQCVWGLDDRFAVFAAGYLDPGASATLSQCIFSRKRNSFWVRAPSPNLSVRQIWNNGIHDEINALSPVYDPAAREYLYLLCVPFQQEGSDDLIPVTVVPGSHDFIEPEWTARQEVVAYEVSNPTNKRVQRIGTKISYGWVPYAYDVCSPE